MRISGEIILVFIVAAFGRLIHSQTLNERRFDMTGRERIIAALNHKVSGVQFPKVEISFYSLLDKFPMVFS